MLGVHQDANIYLIDLLVQIISASEITWVICRNQGKNSCVPNISASADGNWRNQQSRWCDLLNKRKSLWETV
jgi:hypothetical protein